MSWCCIVVLLSLIKGGSFLQSAAIQISWSFMNTVTQTGLAPVFAGGVEDYSGGLAWNNGSLFIILESMLVHEHKLLCVTCFFKFFMK